VAFREIAALIGRRLGVPVVGVPAQEAAAHFGWFAGFAGMDAPGSSAWTREVLGWDAQGSLLLDDVDSEYYFPL
jgi:hypothetical protein